ncbi:MAG: DUF1552 domain-containing protein [Myxococcaceae bacterium]|nr:DUF1552 domain-containing protein [Myxococcaceae bacterium]
MKEPVQLGRRSFLVGASGLALAVPFLPSLARAQAAAPSRCFFSWRIANGYFGDQWYPSASAMNAAPLVEPNVRELALSSLPGPISPILDAEFDPFRSDMLLLRHVDHLSWMTGHKATPALTGWCDFADTADWNTLNPGVDVTTLPPSIDQLMAKKLYGAVAVPPLNLSINFTANNGWSCSYTKGSNGRFVAQPGLYPHAAYNLLFAGLGNGGTSVAARRAQLRADSIDLVRDHFTAVKNNPALSSEDKKSLTRYVDEVQQLGQRLRTMTGGACAPPSAPPLLQPDEATVDQMARAHVDIALAAVQCGLTRVVNLYLDPDVVMPGINSRGHHSASHDTTAADIGYVLASHRWSMKHLKRLLTGLKGAIDPSNGQSYLHNSLVLLTNEIGNQSGSSGTSGTDLNHESYDMQVALFGSANGYLRPGYLLDYRTDHRRGRWSEWVGIAYNRVLITAMLAMGLTPPDWEVGGVPGYGSLRGDQYSQTPIGKVVIGNLRSPLPRVAR